MLILRCLLIGFLSGSLAAAQSPLTNGVFVRPNAATSTHSVRDAMGPDRPASLFVAHAIARSYAVLSLAGDDERARGEIASVLARHGCHADIVTDLDVSSLDQLLMMALGIGVDVVIATVDTTLLHESRDCRAAKALLDAVHRGEITADNLKAQAAPARSEPLTSAGGAPGLAAPNPIDHYLVAVVPILLHPIVVNGVRAFATYVLLRPEVGHTPTLLDHEIAEAQRELREALVQEFYEDRNAFHERVEERERREQGANDASAGTSGGDAVADPNATGTADDPGTGASREEEDPSNDASEASMGSQCDAPNTLWDPAIEEQCAAQRAAEFAEFVAALERIVERCPLGEAERTLLDPNDPRWLQPETTCDEHAVMQELTRLTVATQAACDADCVDDAIAERRQRQADAAVDAVLEACIGPQPHVDDPHDAGRFDACQRARDAHVDLLTAPERTLSTFAAALGLPVPSPDGETSPSGWPRAFDPSPSAAAGMPALPQPDGAGP